MHLLRALRRSLPPIALAIAATLLGCTADLGTGSEQVSPPTFAKGRGHGVVSCAPQAADVVTQVIGPKGGKIKFGKHTLEIPKGALAGPVRITAEAVADSANSVRFEPHGLVFQRATRLTLDYGSCAAPEFADKRIVYTDDLLNILDALFSLDDPKGKKITGKLWHFSRYAVAF
ncbi:MAG: hypothetical protein ABI647_21680 [Gemmatimonadota bacterium]